MSFPRITPVLFSLFVLLGNTRCHTQPLPVLSGKITVSPGWKPVVYLIQPRNFSEVAANYSGVAVDSCAIAADGSFAFPKMPGNTTKGLFQVCVQQQGSRYPTLLTDDNPLNANYIPVVLQSDGAVNISAESGRFQASFSIRRPSEENAALLQLRDMRHASFQQHLAGYTEAPDENNLLEHEAALLHFREPLMAFADSTSQFWPALVAARWVSPEADYERVPEFLFRQCKKWVALTHGSPWSQQLCAAANPEKLPVQTGSDMPDFPMPMSSGDTLALYALLGKRLTIVDIWASWCAPCRRENREVLVPLYREYKEKGLQIVGYSIDSSRDAWKSAIAKDATGWPHASHLLGDATPFMEALHITTIPANFIVDARGKIVAKNLHGEALKAFVAHYDK